MESEKVKEIKKALKYNIKLGLSYEDEKKSCKVWLAEILSLINELESENEKLQNKNYRLEQNLGQCENGYKLELHTSRCQLHSANEDLDKAKDRIAELEKENAKLLDSVETVQSNRCVYKCVLTKEHLKQFAERLKEEFIKSANIQDSITAKKLFRDICTVKVDKVLKKFIKEFTT